MRSLKIMNNPLDAIMIPPAIELVGGISLQNR
jgi:hypothetical protein